MGRAPRDWSLLTPSHNSGRRAQTLRPLPTLPPPLPLFLQSRFTHGMFTVYPGFGSIPSGGMQVITVDCVADPVGRCEEFIAIDISDRDPRDQPAGIPYTLLAEACQPGTGHSAWMAPPERPSSVTVPTSCKCLTDAASPCGTLELPLVSPAIFSFKTYRACSPRRGCAALSS